MYGEEFNGKVFVPSNIRNNKKSIIGKFDLRDISFIMLAGAIFAAVFFSTHAFFTNSTSLVLSLAFSVPILIAGFSRFDGLKIEEYLMVMKANKILSSKVRINNSDNLYETLERNKAKTQTIDKKKKSIGLSTFLTKKNEKRKNVKKRRKQKKK